MTPMKSGTDCMNILSLFRNLYRNWSYSSWNSCVLRRDPLVLFCVGLFCGGSSGTLYRKLENSTSSFCYTLFRCHPIFVVSTVMSFRCHPNFIIILGFSYPIFKCVAFFKFCIIDSQQKACFDRFVTMHITQILKLSLCIDAWFSGLTIEEGRVEPGYSPPGRRQFGVPINMAWRIMYIHFIVKFRKLKFLNDVSDVYWQKLISLCKFFFHRFWCLRGSVLKSR